jgi:hypothetical protein
MLIMQMNLFYSLKFCFPLISLTPNKNGGVMNVVDALIAHHHTLRQLYRQSEADPGVFEEFVRHLVVHHTMEEKYFYDLLEGFEQGRHDALEAVNEHHIIELIVKDAEGFPRDHGNFPIKIEGLGEYTTHHLDEEEADIFPMALELFDEKDLNALGKLFEEAKAIMLGAVPPELPAALAAKLPQNAGTSKASKRTAASVKPDAAAGLGIGSLKK